MAARTTKKAKSSKASKSTSRKTTVKKTSQKVAREAKQAAENVQETTKKIAFSKNTLTKTLVWVFVILVGILLTDYLVQIYYNSPAAIVNGNRISYSKLDERLRQSYGNETVENLINEQIVLEQGQKQKVDVSDEDVQKEYDTYAQSFPGGEEQLLEQLKDQNIDKDELLRRIEVTLTVNALVKDRVKAPSEEEIKSYYDVKYSYLSEENKPKYDEVKDTVRDELIQNNTQEEIPTWLEEVKADAKIRNNVADKAETKPFGLTVDLIKKAAERVSGLFSGKAK